MGKRAFNLSETIRDYRKSHRGASAKTAFAAIKAANPSQKINEGTFKSTFYKLVGHGRGSHAKAQTNGHAGANGRLGALDSRQTVKEGLAFLKRFPTVKAATTFLEFVGDVKEAIGK
jgi:hypothetical protein